MRTALAGIPRLTFEEFLHFEASSAVKHEFHQGELFAMAVGCSKDHETVVGNVYLGIRGRLAGHVPCRVYLSGTMVRVDAADAAYYPDLHVTCDPRDHRDPRSSRHPALIVEVLSKSTRDYDAGGKFNGYKLLDSLREYVLIDSEAQAITVCRRVSARRWDVVDLELGDALVLDTIDLTLDFAEIYARTDVPLPRPPLHLVPESDAE